MWDETKSVKNITDLNVDFNFNLKKAIHDAFFLDSDNEKKKIKHYDMKNRYVLAAKGIEHAKSLLFSTFKKKKSYCILGPTVGGEEAIFMCSDELPPSFSLYTFVLEKGLVFDNGVIYKKWTGKKIGELNAKWAISAYNKR